MGKREANKKARRERILEAASSLLAEGGAEALTMREVARRAGLSEMTPYNLFGSKGGIVTALFERTLAEVLRRSFVAMPTDPLERLFVGAEAVADAWTEGGGRFKALIRCTKDEGVDMSPFHSGPRMMLEMGVSQVLHAGLITDEVSVRTVAHHIFVANQGAYDLWATGVTDDSELRRDLVRGLAMALLTVATPDVRARLLTRLAD